VLYTQLEQLRTAAAQFAGPTTGITIYAPKKVRGVKTIEISGSLRFPDGSPADGAALTVEYLPAVTGAAWRTVGTSVASSDGSWRTNAELPASGSLRAVFAGDRTRGQLTSPPRKITVLARLNLSLSRNRIRLGSRIRVRGTADPATRVRLMLDVRHRRRWLRSRTRLVRVRRGAYNTVVRPRGRGKYRVTVQVGGIKRHRTLKVF
jgi:hypothetical protein